MRKGKTFLRKITKKDDFRASRGWLDNFTQRFGIRFLAISREKLSSDVTVIIDFQKKFELKIQELGLLPKPTYNADESGLFWMMLPQKTFAQSSEESTLGEKKCLKIDWHSCLVQIPLEHTNFGC